MNKIEIEHKLEDLGFEYTRAIELGEKWNGCTTDEFDKYVEETKDLSQKYGTQEKVNQTSKPVDNIKVNLVNQQKVNQSNTQFIGIKVSEELKNEISCQAKELDMPVSSLVRDILTQKFKLN